MSDATVAVIRAMNDAFNARRYEEMMELWAPDADFIDHLPLPDVPAELRGHEQMRSVLERWNEGFKVFEGDVEEYVDLGDYVVAVTSWRFVSTDEGIETRWRGAEAWQVREGRVVWGQTGFLDRRAAVEAVAERRRAPG
ncbi:MAG TPA: nuclear transport factor 2 family protein [Solirubrobacteraceae bacterium]|jgi:ketosteroid isomerase-like protein|nr:nuclear transport factor 2 family protein [Solirubrobacteraceae bacterium]